MVKKSLISIAVRELIKVFRVWPNPFNALDIILEMYINTLIMDKALIKRPALSLLNISIPRSLPKTRKIHEETIPSLPAKENERVTLFLSLI